MTGLDILVLALMGGAAALGFSRGFVTESLSLGAWVFAIAVVKTFHAPVAAALGKTVGTPSGASMLATLLTFGLAMFVGRKVARKIGGGTRNSFVGPFDRALGFGFGAIKGLLLATVLFLFVSLFYNVFYGAQSPRPGWMTSSRTYPLLSATSRAVVNFVQERQGKSSPQQAR